MKIIINADDFGMCKGVNLGIIDAYRDGLVRSATMMAGMPGFSHALELAGQNPGLRIGVHLTLSAGKSVGGVYRTITDDQGNFLKLAEAERRAKAGELNLSEVEAEYEAQINKIKDTGIVFDHFDSHHHTHNLPGNIGVFLKLAKKYGVGVRVYDRTLLTGEYADIKTTSGFADDFYNETATIEDLKRIITSHGGDSLEIMSHPAFVDYALYHGSSYNLKRFDELNVLTSGEMRAFVRENKLEICSFSEL